MSISYADAAPTLASRSRWERLLDRAARHRWDASPWNSDQLLREELFSIERLEEHAASLAVAQKISVNPVARPALSVRLKDDESVLLAAYRATAAAVAEGCTVTPAAEWLLDNYHVVDEQIREIRQDLPPGYYRQLPKLADGPFAGYPRVFGLAWAYVAHTDSRFDADALRRYLHAYQRVQPLTIGELWAVAITLRVVLVENLRRAAQRSVHARVARREADQVADKLLGLHSHPAEPDALLHHGYHNVALPTDFAAQLVQRLRDQDPRVTPALLWLEERLVAQGTTSAQIVREEHQRQGASNVTVRNIITSMRLMSDVDWSELFEQVSLVDDALRAGSEFGAMDFPTRNLYRSAIEQLARYSLLSELEVARTAVVAQGGQDGEADVDAARRADPGFRLIGKGRPAFERTIGWRLPLRFRLGEFASTRPIGYYIATITLLAAILLALPLFALAAHGISAAALAALALAGVVPAFDVAVALLNGVVTRRVGARILPGLALRGGVPPELRTMVAIPILLTSHAALIEQIERLEIHHLASPEGDLHFALLSDWSDARSERTPADAAIVEAAAEGIARLNRNYAPVSAGPRFFLFHRRRCWSESQQRWMGWERKRGKLHELNRLLRGATDTTFVDLDGRSPVAPPDVRFVITLDADTQLPRDAARRLIGKLAHPLNRPRFDRVCGRVIDGHAVLQPRVTAELPSRRRGSIFQRVFSGTPGMDPYAAAASDVYQDLFGEGSYTGKGIYDVDAFEAALAGRVPADALLSHDLFEGIFARAGLVSDIEVVEEFPARYDVAAQRQHRWARGDWQLLPWILGRRSTVSPLRGGDGAIPLIGRWKMLDNLRRSLTAPATVIALLTGWVLLEHSAAMIWTAVCVAALAIPPALPALEAIIPRRLGITARSHGRALRIDAWQAASQAVLLLTFLAQQAWSMTDAITRSLYRVFVSHRKLLEWVTAAQSDAGARLDWSGMYRHMAGGVVIGGVAVTAAAVLHADNVWIAAPFGALWAAAPAVARWVTRSPNVTGRMAVTTADRRELRLIARRTWRYFEMFVGPGDHMLPPDNVQEDPREVTAHRTSPTNIGLYLMSAVSAHDFGWIGVFETIERLEATLATLGALDHCHGHLYNWYDTRDLRPLEPRYVSSVDSGNLAAHLIAVAHACSLWIQSPRAATEILSGVGDAVELARVTATALAVGDRDHEGLRQKLAEALIKLAAVLGSDGRSQPLESRLAAAAAHAATLTDITRALGGDAPDNEHLELTYWAKAVGDSIASGRRDLATTHAGVLELRLQVVATTALEMSDAMDFAFLMNPERRLLSIGYRATDGVLDPNCYDLLASEARLASFVAIAKGDAPARHWFRLGRAVTPVGSGAALISWSGSMFEYLMPALVMRAPAGSLLDQTNRLIVRRQIAYARTLGVPWGVSESAYNARDLELTYQYSNFGVPGLGLKRGLSESLVIAPYATALAAMVDPEAAMRNFERLAARGTGGRFGFCEALDYTRSRVPEGADVAIVRAFMAHHQGMTIVAIANALFDGRMRDRFHAHPGIQATELLLQERTPRDVAAVHPRAEEVMTAARMGDLPLPEVRRIRTPNTATPQTHLLSNGRYAVMLTAAGSGYSRWRDLAVTRWREDATRDDHGSYVFLRDLDSGAVWSAGLQPSGVEAETYEAIFVEGRAELVRRDDSVTTVLEIAVSPEDDAEVRRVSMTNTGSGVREIEVTSYCELVLAPLAADIAHPAFSKLFITTEFIAPVGALVATRRARSAAEPTVWAAHHAVVEGDLTAAVEVETDRARFLGRGRELRESVAGRDGQSLSNSVGAVLDAVFALRYRLQIAPGATARIAFWTTVAATRQGVVDLVDKHHEPSAFARVCTLAWTQAQVELRHLGIGAAEATLFQRLAGYVLFADAALRPPPGQIQRGAASPTAIWSQGISGDLPIVLLRIADIEDLAIARQLLRAHEYWRAKLLAVDLVILNERPSSYIQDLQTALETVVRTSQSRPQVDGDAARGRVFVLRADLLSAETRAALSSSARVVLNAPRGSLEEQLRRVQPVELQLPLQRRLPARSQAPAPVPMPRDLEFFNGLGGFSANGREYVVVLGAGQTTPAPWINVIANPHFGFQVAVEGSGFTWSLNSREYQLTPWSNDAVTDRPAEVLYVHDTDTGELWCPTATPIRDEFANYHVRHGQGYSVFEHSSRGIGLELTQFVPLNDAIKVSRLSIRNESQQVRQLSVTGYLEWVLGSGRSTTAPSIVTSIDVESRSFMACNPASAAFAARVAFADLRGRQISWTGDRREFLGRHGTLAHPAALATARPLSNRVGAGLDPCCALQAPVRLEPNGAVEIVLVFGDAATTAEARELVERYRLINLDQVLHEVGAHWDAILDTVQVKTPDRSLDIMLNRWLLYQTLVCRMWARCGFYQASGAYGFRDQLQDGMALALSAPALTRAHLLRAAARQFSEGDVQHWWLPHSGQGVRTRVSDDRIWLAYAVHQYIETTGDLSILDAPAPFLEGQTLAPGESDAYFQPAMADGVASVYEHCARALDQSLDVGAHGLPLMGTGDWNDGMNRVGELGLGESVWLGWFLYATLVACEPVARARGDSVRAARWSGRAATLREALENSGWDGEWYRRAYFDDGTPLGTADGLECRIDSIAQSWSVISGAGELAHTALAMRAVQEQLVDRGTGLALLFAPPFERTPLEPGYIKAYPPGVRENGGQYTHAAAWSVIALAILGEGDAARALIAMLNPVNHALTGVAMQRYRVEPYVAAADVYSVAPHAGRGGWTWYTGSAGWMYRAGLEWILGIKRRGRSLLVAPCIPRGWPRADVALRYGTARYNIIIENPDAVSHGVRRAELDGQVLPSGSACIPLSDDGAVHVVRVVLGEPEDAGANFNNACR